MRIGEVVKALTNVASLKAGMLPLRLRIAICVGTVSSALLFELRSGAASSGIVERRCDGDSGVALILLERFF